MMAFGAMAALSVKHVSKRWSGFGAFARRAPYFSSGLILLVGLYVGFEGGDTSPSCRERERARRCSAADCRDPHFLGVSSRCEAFETASSCRK